MTLKIINKKKVFFFINIFWIYKVILSKMDIIAHPFLIKLFLEIS